MPIIILLVLLLSPLDFCLAGLLDRSGIDDQVDSFNSGAGYVDSTPEYIIGTVISIFLSILGVIFIILMLYGGYNWMIARGEEEKVSEAKNTIRNAIIGLIIVVSSYAIWWFIFENFINK